MTFSDVTDAQTAGIGLYLALAIVQGVSAGGLATIRRQSDALAEAVKLNNLAAVRVSSRTLRNEVLRLDVVLSALNRNALVTVVVLVSILCGHLVYSLTHKSYELSVFEQYILFGTYLGLPFVLFGGIAAVVAVKCLPAQRRLATLRDEVMKSLVGSAG